MRIQFRLLFVLIFAIGGLAIGATILHRYQVIRTSDFVVSRARIFAKENENAKAVEFYRRYLVMRSDDSVARSEYAQLLVDFGELDTAFFELETALRGDPTLNKMRLKLVEIAIELNRVNDAKAHLTEHLIPGEPENAEYRWLLGKCEQQLGEFAAARQLFERAVQLADDNFKYARDLANLLADRFSDPSAARSTLDHLIVQSNQSADAHVVRGRWLLGRTGKLAGSEKEARQGLLDAAWDDAWQALQLDPQAVHAVGLAVDVAAELNRLEQVRPFVSRAIEAHPDVAELYMNSARLELLDGDPANALNVLRAGLQAIPGQASLMLSITDLELDQGNIATAEQLIEQMRALEFADAPIRFLEARILVLQGKWRNAAQLIESSRGLFDRNSDLLKRANLILAECYQRLGNVDQQLASLRRAVRIDPLSQDAREKLALALFQSGRFQEAMSEYNQLVAKPNPPVSAIVALARLRLLDSLRLQDTDFDWAELEQVLLILEQVPEAADDLAILRAEICYAEERFEDAEQLLRSRMNSDPSAIEPRKALIAIYARNKQWEKAEEVLNETEKSLPDSPELRSERAKLLILRDGQSVAMDSLERLATPGPNWSQDQQTDLAFQFAKYFLSINDYSRCEKLARVVADSQRGQSDLSVHLLLFDLAFRSRHAASMAQSLDHVASIAGNGPIWRLGEAIRLCVEADALSDQETPQKQRLFAKAIEHLTEASLRRPGWSRIPRLQGEIHDRQNRRDLAIREYMKAISLGDTEPQFIARAVALLVAERRFGEADQLVRKLQLQERRSPFSSSITRMAAEVSLQLEDFDRALTLAKSWAKQSQRQEDHIWISQIYRITNNQEAAIKQLQIAIEMDRAAPAPWVLLIQMHASAGDVESAREVIRQAELAIDSDAVADALAQGYESINDFQTAESYYQRSLALDPNDTAVLRRFANFYLRLGSQDLALPLLDRLVANKGETALVDRTWARGNLALVLGLQKNPDSYRRARELLTANDNEIGKTDQDQRVLATILGAQGDRKSVQQAIEILTELIGQQAEFSLNDNFLLAELYARIGEWTQYTRAMRNLLSNGGVNDARYVRRYAELLQERGEDSEAKLWIDRLKQLEPRELATGTIEAKQLFRAKDFDRLLALLEPRKSETENVKSDTTQLQRLYWSAEGAESFGRALREQGDQTLAERFFAQAAQAYEEISEVGKDQTFALASFHARQGDIDSAIGLIPVGDVNPLQLVDLSQDAIHSQKLTTHQASELISRLESASAIDHTNARIGVGIGDLYGWQGNTAKATEVYRSVLGQHPDHMPALNNMAFVLALSDSDHGKPEPSVELAKKLIGRAITIAGPLHFLLDTRGIVHLAAGDAGAAAADFQTALKIAPRPQYYVHLAQALVRSGDEVEAGAAIQQAIDSGATVESLHPLERPAFLQLIELAKTTTAE